MRTIIRLIRFFLAIYSVLYVLFGVAVKFVEALAGVFLIAFLCLVVVLLCLIIDEQGIRGIEVNTMIVNLPMDMLMARLG